MVNHNPEFPLIGKTVINHKGNKGIVLVQTGKEFDARYSYVRIRDEKSDKVVSLCLSHAPNARGEYEKRDGGNGWVKAVI